MKIEIIDTKVFERSVHSKTGKDLTFRTQKGYAHLPDRPFPVEVNIQLWDRQPFPVGVYTLGDSTYKVDRYGNLGLKSILDLT